MSQGPKLNHLLSNVTIALPMASPTKKWVSPL